MSWLLFISLWTEFASLFATGEVNCSETARGFVQGGILRMDFTSFTRFSLDADSAALSSFFGITRFSVCLDLFPWKCSGFVFLYFVPSPPHFRVNIFVGPISIFSPLPSASLGPSLFESSHQWMGCCSGFQHFSSECFWIQFKVLYIMCVTILSDKLSLDLWPCTVTIIYKKSTQFDTGDAKK